MNERQIKTEYTKLSKLYADMPVEQRKLYDGLIHNTAFMAVELKELQSQIAKNGAVESYTNGENQGGLKPSAALSAYNQLIKNYQAAIKTLDKALPTPSGPSKLEKLLNG